MEDYVVLHREKVIEDVIFFLDLEEYEAFGKLYKKKVIIGEKGMV
jgi:hypothetical protein